MAEYLKSTCGHAREIVELRNNETRDVAAMNVVGDVSCPNRVVVTGIGMVTPLGSDRESSWRLLKAGVSATRWLKPEELGERIHDTKPSWGSVRFAGAPACLGEPCADTQRPEAFSELVIKLALRAAEEAVADARLDLPRLDLDRIGCVIGTSKGGLRSFSRAFEQHGHDPNAISPSDWMQFLPNASAAAVSKHFGLRGPSLCPVAACATGLASLVRGFELVRSGTCDVVLAGSSDASLQESILASFHRMGVMARQFHQPATACRPFDRYRNGFLVGEGAAVLVMERYEQALARGADLYAEWLSAGLATDPVGITRLDDRAAGLTRLIRDVLRRATLTSAEIDYVNLHGTATIQNDLCETTALKAALGPAARSVRCSSLKGGIGHLLGAAGSVEMAASLLAIRDRTIPPTVNLEQCGDGCDLDYTPRHAQTERIENFLKLSLGFGGHLLAAVVRAV